MDETTNNEVVLMLGLKDQLIINVAGAIVGLLASKLVEKTYVGVKTRIVSNRSSANTTQ